MIEIKKSPNADSRTATNLTIEKLELSTKQHIQDVTKGMEFFAELIKEAGIKHDSQKMNNLDEFFKALTSGNVCQSRWYSDHVHEERHHITRYVHDDINLIDVIEHIVDCCMAGLARNSDGKVYDLRLPAGVLERAYQNTVELLNKNTKLVE